MLKGLSENITLAEIQNDIKAKMDEVNASDTMVIKLYIIYNFKKYLTLLEKRQELTEKNINLYF